MNRRSRLLLLLVIAAVLGCCHVQSVQACGLFRCWRCRHHSSYDSSYGSYSSPSQAPSQAPAPQQTPAYTFSAPMMYYAVPQQAPPGAQNFVPELKAAIDILRLLREVRGELNVDEDSTTEPSVTSKCNLDEVHASLARLEAEQKELRGRIINVAGISQSIGLKLVEVNERVSAIEKATGATGDITKELAKINRSILDLELGGNDPPTADAANANANADAGAAGQDDKDLKAAVTALQGEMKTLKGQVSEIRTMLLEDRKKAAEGNAAKPDAATKKDSPSNESTKDAAPSNQGAESKAKTKENSEKNP